FFAIEKASIGGKAAIWAVNHNWCMDRAARILSPETWHSFRSDRWHGKSGPAISRIFATKIPFIMALNSHFLDERLAIQQGTFLPPIDISKSFESNILAMDNKANIRDNIRKVIVYCTSDLISEALGELQRVNVTRRTLFPGIDGLAN